MPAIRPGTLPPTGTSTPGPPIGQTIGGAYVVEERLRGELARGQYRARRIGRPDLGSFLVTLTTPQKEPLPVVEARLRIAQLGGGRISPLRHLGAIEVAIAPGQPPATYHALVEDEPPGRPLHLEATARLPVPVVVELGIELARALEEVHRGGAAVLGVRPELVYVGRFRERLVLTGLAPRCERFCAGATPPGYGVVPSFEDVYLAPEQIGLREAGPAADVFTTCMLLARLINGAYPFEGDGPWSKAESIMASRRRRLRGPMALVGLLCHGLALRPEDRLTASELAVELARLA